MYRVVLRPSADADLEAIYRYLAETSGSDQTAISIIRRLRRHCESLRDFPMRGRSRDDIREDLRTLVFERRAIIAYVVKNQTVLITRIFYRGQDFERLLTQEADD